MAGFLPSRAVLRSMVWASLLGAAWSGAAADVSSTLFPAHGDVLLLAGIPGDSESENTYREQLKGWVELIQGHSEPHKIVLLCDQPESLGLAPAPQLELIPANRTNFVHLIASFAQSTNSVVV